MRDHADPGPRDRIEIPGHADELRHTGDDEEQSVDLAATFSRLTARLRAEECTTDEASRVTPAGWLR